MTVTYLEVTVRCIPEYGATLSKFTVCFLAASYGGQALLTVWPVCGVPKNHQQFENISSRQQSDFAMIALIYHLAFPVTEKKKNQREK